MTALREAPKPRTLVAREPTVVIAGFDPSADAPRRARKFVADVLSERGEGELIGDAKLIISELATNAVVHAGSRFQVAVHFQRERGTVTLSVSDTSSAKPELCRPGPTDPDGRGLRVVDAVAHAWGCSPARAGKSVWAELAR